MARESIFIDEIRQTSKPTVEVTKSTHADVVIDIFVQILRECFSRHPLYTYIAREDSAGPDFERTQIVIVDRYTEEAMFLPTITTSFNSANTKWLQFSQSPFQTVLKPQMNSDGSIARDLLGKALPSHFEYTGAYDSSVSFLISASDTLEREELANLIHVLLAETLRDELYVRGIFVKNVNVGGPTEIEYREDYIYQVPVTAEIYSEWKRMIPVGETLESIGFQMNVTEGTSSAPTEPAPTPNKIPIHNLENQFFVIDDLTQEPIIPCLKLSATSETAPITLIYNSTTARWEVSDFWIKALEQTLIPYENFKIEINKESAVAEFLTEAGKAILQAETLRGLSLSQGRTLPDGTKVIGRVFIKPDGEVQLKAGIDLFDPLVYSTTVEGDNTVIFRFAKSNRNRSVLVAKDVTIDGYGTPLTGTIHKRTTAGDILLSGVDTDFLDGENINTMTAIDLFMIMQFAQQPFRYSLTMILEEIDKLLVELADFSITISNRTAKIASITSIKQELIERTESYLLERTVGL